MVVVKLVDTLFRWRKANVVELTHSELSTADVGMSWEFASDDTRDEVLNY